MKKKNEKILVSALAGMTALQGMSTTLMSVCAQENNETTHVSVMNVKMSQKDELESKLNDSKKDVGEKTLALDSAKGALSVASKQVEILESKQDEKSQLVQQDYQAMYDAINSKLQPLLDEITNLEGQIKGAKKDLDDKISASQKAATDLEEAQNTLASKKDALEQLQKKLDSFKGEGDLTKELEKATQEKDVAEKAVNDAQKNVDDANTVLSQATSDAGNKKVALDQANQSLDAALADVSEKQKIVEEKQALVDSFNEDTTKAELEQAKTDLNLAKDRLSKAQESVNTATSVYNDAVTIQEKAQQAYDTSCQDLENTKATLAQAQDALAKVQEDVNNLQSQMEKKNEEIKGLNTKIDAAKSDVNKAQSKYDKALNDYNSISSPLDQAKKNLNDFETKYAAELARLNQGSKGYFDSIGCSDLANYVFKVDNSAEGKLASYTHLGQADDATSLKNMQASIPYLKECNEIRKQEGLPELKVSAWLMAVAQVNANHAKYNIEHAGVYVTGENLAWGYGDANTAASPYRGWYDEEKAEYLAGNHNFSDIGHYKNIVEGRYTVTGYAIGTNGQFSMAHCQEFLDEVMGVDDDVQMTVSEFEQSFNDYCNNLKSVDSQHKTLQDAVKNAASLNTKDDTALKQAESELNSKTSVLSDLQAQLAQAKTDKKVISDNMDAKQNEVSKLKNSVKELSSEVKQKEKAKSEKESQLKEAKKNVESKANEKKDKENALTNIHNEQSTIQNKIDTLSNRLNNWDANKAQANQDLKDAKASLKDAKALAKTQKENADALKDEYEKALDVKSKAKESADKYLSILKQKQDTFNEKVDHYDAAKQASDDYKNTVEELNVIKQEVGEVTNKIQSLQEKQKTLKADIQTLKDEIVTLNDSLTKSKDKALPEQTLMNLLNEIREKGSKVDLSKVEDATMKEKINSLAQNVDSLNEVNGLLEIAKTNYQTKYELYQNAKKEKADADANYNKAMQALNDYLNSQVTKEAQVTTNKESVHTGVDANVMGSMLTSMVAGLGLVGILHKKRKEEK